MIKLKPSLKTEARDKKQLWEHTYKLVGVSRGTELSFTSKIKLSAHWCLIPGRVCALWGLAAFCISTSSSCFKNYSWPLNNVRLGCQPPARSKSVYNFGLTLKLNSLLLSRNLTDNVNSQLTHILYMCYILYS